MSKFLTNLFTKKSLFITPDLLLGNSLFIIIVFYLVFDLFMINLTGYENYSHIGDIIVYPIISLMWLLLSKNQTTNFNRWSNRIILITSIIFAIVFYSNFSEPAFMTIDHKIISVGENTQAYYVELESKNSDDFIITTYSISKTDTLFKPTIDNKVYISYTVDILNDTLYGRKFLKYNDEYKALKYIERTKNY